LLVFYLSFNIFSRIISSSIPTTIFISPINEKQISPLAINISKSSFVTFINENHNNYEKFTMSSSNSSHNLWIMIWKLANPKLWQSSTPSLRLGHSDRSSAIIAEQVFEKTQAKFPLYSRSSLGWYIFTFQWAMGNKEG